MKIHWLQHVSFEGLGLIEGWLLERGHTLSRTRLFENEPLPQGPDGFDWLIVMGGPMNAYQHRDYPWLPAEKQLIGQAISAGKRVLGVCLGAQLIADVLGAKVYQNHHRELGWFPVRPVPEGASSPFALSRETFVMHWHGDTFSLPPGSAWLCRSEGCANQAYAIGSRVLGLQFHLEMSRADIGRALEICAEDLMPGRFIQPIYKIDAQAIEYGPEAAALLDHLLTVQAS
jgi:GMP synthase-like glutamine amidotransferase